MTLLVCFSCVFNEIFYIDFSLYLNWSWSECCESYLPALASESPDFLFPLVRHLHDNPPISPLTAWRFGLSWNVLGPPVTVDVHPAIPESPVFADVIVISSAQWQENGDWEPSRGSCDQLYSMLIFLVVFLLSRCLTIAPPLMEFVNWNEQLMLFLQGGGGSWWFKSLEYWPLGGFLTLLPGHNGLSQVYALEKIDLLHFFNFIFLPDVPISQLAMWRSRWRVTEVWREDGRNISWV